MVYYSKGDDLTKAKQLILRPGDNFHVYRGLRHQMVALEDSEATTHRTCKHCGQRLDRSMFAARQWSKRKAPCCAGCQASLEVELGSEENHRQRLPPGRFLAD